MANSLIKKYRAYKDWKRVVWNGGSKFKIPFSKKLKYAIRGFSANEYVWYNFEKNDYREYISEYDRWKSRDINGQYKFVLDDKLIFEEVVGQYVKVPTNYAWIEDGIVYGLHDNGMNNDNITDYLKQYKKTVLKWNGRGGGEGTYVIAFENNRFYVNEEEREADYIISLFSRPGNAILCEYMHQSSFASSLYPHTTNTIRIVCAKKKGERDAKFIVGIQRVGCEQSIPVDNVSSGGLTLDIDSKTGELGEGIAKYGKKERVLVPFKCHPDTGEPFVGKRIPNWDKLIEEVVSLTNKLPYLNFVAWDILLTDDGFCVIEGNASSGCALFQMKHGVKNSELGDIYRSYKVFDN